MNKRSGILNGYIIPRKLTSQPKEHIGNYLKKTCPKVEIVEQGWLVTGPNNEEYYVTPYKLWKPKGRFGKRWYHYKDVESLVEKHLSRGLENKNAITG
jgi:hypothetical protein